MKIKLMIVSLALAALAGCETAPKIQSEHNPATDFASFKKYAIAPLPTSIPGGDPGLVLRTGQIVKDAVEAQLDAKGYVQVAEMKDADFVVNLTGKVVPKTDITDMGYTAMPSRGWYGYYTPYSYNYGRDVYVDQYEEGTLIIEIYQVSDKDMVWVGWGEARRKGGPPDPVKIQEGVAAILAQFPPM